MKRITLISGSSQRQQFLRGLDVPHETVFKLVEETCPAHPQREQITDYLAESEAAPFEGEVPPNYVLLTSNTLVWHEGGVLGKPKDVANAFAVLHLLSGKTHEVITSMCFIADNAQDTYHYITRVILKGPTDKEIAHYTEKHKPFDKVGAYDIQGWVGRIGVVPTEGSYNNIMGLPTHLICQFINQQIYKLVSRKI